MDTEGLVRGSGIGPFFVAVQAKEIERAGCYAGNHGLKVTPFITIERDNSFLRFNELNFKALGTRCPDCELAASIVQASCAHSPPPRRSTRLSAHDEFGCRLWLARPCGHVILGEPQKNAEEQNPPSDIRRHQQVLFHMLVTILAEPPREVWMCQQVPYLVSATFNRMHQDAGKFMNHLRGNSANGAGNRRLGFP